MTAPTPRPLRWKAYEETPGGLRIHYDTSGTAHGPNFPLHEVLVEERDADVTVKLSEAVPADGGMEFLLLWNDCVVLRLKRPLGDRAVIDGATGRPVASLARQPHTSVVGPAECRDARELKPRKRPQAR